MGAGIEQLEPAADLSEQVSVGELDEWPVQGEVPAISPKDMKEAADKHFERVALNLTGRKLKEGLEIATKIGDKVEIVISEHGIEIAIGTTIAGLSVAGVFAATKLLHPRQKK